jgi:hypothetical protein
MTTCPYCHGPVDSAVEAEGRCAVCGRSLLEPGVPGPGTPDEVETLRATLFQVVRRGPELSELIGEDPAPASDAAKTVADPAPSPADQDELRTLVSNSLPAAPDELQKTLDSGSISPSNVDELRTLASGSLPPVPPPPPGWDADAQRTLESGSVPKLSAAQIEATIDSKSGLSAGQAARVSAIWGLARTPAGNPLKTIKASDAAYANKSTLVIKTRAFSRTQDVETGGADYELLELLGKGGMGVVYAARQASIDREVAVKMLNSENAADVMQRFKFLSEAVVTGELDHPNIVPIHDLGANESGALFYSMKRVRGTPWMEALGKKSRAENLDILMKVADAIAFAHSRGVVHRDLKPENVMLGGFGEVLVMDWGLALSTPDFRKSSSITQSNSMGGTPAYMAPEMATGPIEKVGPLSDVYLLGACLFEVIAGKPPHTGSNVMNCLYAAACNKIVAVDQHGELMDVALKAMATEPEDRFASVQEFQTAIREYQSHSESILLSSRAEQDLEKAKETDKYDDFARVVFGYDEALALWPGNAAAAAGGPLARWAYAASALNKGDYDLGLSLLDPENPEHRVLREELLDAQTERESRQQRLQRTRKMARVLLGTIFVVITTALAVVFVAWNDAQVQRGKALEAAGRLEISNKDLAKANLEVQANLQQAIAARASETYRGYVSKIGLAAAQIDSNSFTQAFSTLRECPPNHRGWEWGRLNYLCHQGRDAFDAKHRLEAVALAPDGQTMVTAAADGELRSWNLLTLNEQGSAWRHGGPVRALAFSPDGRWLISAGGDAARQIKIWDRATGQVLRSLDCGKGTALSMALSSDGRWLIAGLSTGHVMLWELATAGEGLDPRLVGRPRANEYEIHALCFAPRAAKLPSDRPQMELVVCGGEDSTVSVIDFSLPEVAWPFPTFRKHEGPVYAVAASPIPGLVASAGDDGRIQLWNPSTLQITDLKASLAGDQQQSSSIALVGHEGEIHSLAFSADGAHLASGGHDNAVRLWNVADRKAERVLRGHGGWVRGCQFFPAGDRLASCGYDGRALCWNLRDYRESLPLVRDSGAVPVLSVGFSPDGSQAVTAHDDGVTMTWDARNGRPLQSLTEGHDFLGESALFVADGRRVLTGARDSTLRLWNLEAGFELRPLGEPLHYSKNVGQSLALAISPDGRLIAAGGDGNSVLVWDSTTLAQKLDLRGHAEQVSAVAFSADSKWLLSGDLFGRCRLWDLSTGKPLATLDGHTRPIAAAAFLPDGRRALTASLDGSVAQWELPSGRELKPLMMRHPGKVVGLAVSADGRTALTGSDDGSVRVWSVESAKLDRKLDGTFENLTSVSISPDGRTAATVESGKELARVRIWDVATGRERPRTSATGDADFGNVWSASFSLDGRRLLTIGRQQARLWDLESGRMVMSYRPHSAVTSAQFSKADRSQVVTASIDRSAKLWNTKSALAEGGKLLGPHDARLTYAEFSPGGARIVTCDAAGKVVIWDRASRKPIVERPAHTKAVNRAVYAPAGDKLLTVSDDGEARLWNTAGDKLDLLRTLTVGENAAPLLSGAFSADGALIVTGGEDNVARVWNASTGAEVVTLSGHTGSVIAVAFSPVGMRVLTGSQDNTAKIWDLGQQAGKTAEKQSGNELMTLNGHTQEVTSVAFAPDGRQALTGSLDGTAILWPADDWREQPPPTSSPVVARR